MTEQEKGRIYRTRMMPIWLERPENTCYFTDREVAKAFLEEYMQEKWGWTPGEWREDIEPSDKTVDMRPIDGHGDARAEVKEVTLHDDVPEYVSDIERTELNVEW